MAKKADLIVRDEADYETAELARASLPTIYIAYPFVGVLKLSESAEEPWMYVFSTRTEEDLVEDGWVVKEPEEG